MKQKDRRGRLRIKLRIKKKIFGTSSRPRLSVYKSLKHIYAQLIDDTRGITLAAAASVEPDIRTQSKATKSRLVGERIALRAKKCNIKRVVFDRGGFKYHGRIRILADAAREGGLEF